MSMKQAVEYQLDYLEKIDRLNPNWQKEIDIRSDIVQIEINRLRYFADEGFSQQVTDACNAKADEWQTRLSVFYNEGY